jgi:heme oxygenase
MSFADDVIAAVTGHMNGDHPEDNLLIARAFGYPDAVSSRMVGVTGEAGVWLVADASGEREVSVPWPGGAISERPEIRREVVALYRSACEKLGVPAREEHGSASPHGAHHHGGAQRGRHAAGDAESGEKPFSTVVRESSWSDHSDSEGATFMEDIMRGKGSLQDYIDLVAQHFCMYEALAHLIGDDWRERIEAVPATAAYAARIREIAEEGWVAGLVAHHYTRYLGDLSGGQMIAKRVAKQHGLDREGIAFYDFSELGSLVDFKNEYRVALDALGAGLDDEERARMLDEVRAAYAFNTAVFIDLGKARDAVAA